MSLQSHSHIRLEKWLLLDWRSPSPAPPVTSLSSSASPRRLLLSDSDLWDLPSVLLTPKSTLDDNSGDLSWSDVEVRGAETIRETLDLSGFDLGLALDQVLKQVGLSIDKSDLKLVLLKFVEEAVFGPGPPINTLFVALSLDFKEEP